ncbi:MAG: HlyD family secretion protein [Muribaculaceae bacterium]|nr:HlyD family secretion protein [Muribaculaceae bacterium]
MKHRTKKILSYIITLAVIVAAGCWVASKFIHFGNVEFTDNAQVGRQIVPVNSRVQGYIKEIRFREYEPVKKGDTLVIIDDADMRLRVAQARADYQNALAGRSVADRSVGVAAANVAVTEACQRSATSSVAAETRQRIAQNDAGIELAGALLETAELNLSYTVITAPCDGYTSRKEIQVGQLVQPGQTLLDVVDTSDVWITANYKETQLQHIHIGSEVGIKVDAIPGKTFTGKVVSMSTATGAALSLLPQDNSAGNFVKVRQRIPVRIELTDSAGMDLLRAGMNVECEVRY